MFSCEGLSALERKTPVNEAASRHDEDCEALRQRGRVRAMTRCKRMTESCLRAPGAETGFKTSSRTGQK